MPAGSLPRSVTCLLDRFRGCFTAPTFETFCALVVGFWVQPQARTVTGMLVAAGLSTPPGTTPARTGSSRRPVGMPTSSAWSCWS